MTYELAKKLKYAGFLQRLGFIYPDYGKEIPPTGKGFREYQEFIASKEGVYNPTLSELIEACGKYRMDKSKRMFFSLTYWPANKLWYAEQSGHQGIDSTPEEATANLWLALNKKDA